MFKQEDSIFKILRNGLILLHEDMQWLRHGGIFSLLFDVFHTPYCPLFFTNFTLKSTHHFPTFFKNMIFSLLVYIWGNLYFKEWFLLFLVSRNEIVDSLYSLTVWIDSHIFLDLVPTCLVPTFLIQYQRCSSSTSSHLVPTCLYSFDTCIHPTSISPIWSCSSGTCGCPALPMFIWY